MPRAIAATLGFISDLYAKSMFSSTRTASGLALFGFTLVCSAADSSLARRRPDLDTPWASFENLAAAKGQGGAENRGAKGHAC